MWKRVVLVLAVIVVMIGVMPTAKAYAIGGCEVRTSLFTLANLTFLGVPLCDVNGGQWVSLATAIKGEDFANDLLKVAPQARSLGGATTQRYISVSGATQNEHAVCSAACTIYSITVTNVNAAVRYLKCDDALIATTVPGTSVPELDLAIPGATTGAGINMSFPVGAAFATGATCWLVNGAAESDVSEVAANELKIFYTKKQ